MQIMISGATSTATSPVFGLHGGGAFQAKVTGTGAVTATVLIEVSIDGDNWLELSTITLSGTTSASDGFVSMGGWTNVRARLTAITGTGAAATVYMS